MKFSIYRPKLAMNKFELVFIPAPAFGHLVSTVEFAKRLLDRDERLSITVLVISTPFTPAVDAYAQALAASNTRIRFINLPPVEPLPFPVQQSSPIPPETLFTKYIDSHKSHVANSINDLLSHESVQLIGLVMDMLCTSFIDIANQVGVPSYLFFASPAAFLGLMLYLPIHHNLVGAEFDPSVHESIIPSYANPVPANVLPAFVFNKGGGYTTFLHHATRFRETKGIILNTFSELESHAVNCIATPPPIYPVGPLLDLKYRNHSAWSKTSRDEIVKWLDHQPASSVVFLCFGSMGSFPGPQLEQIATALERSGHGFLWSVRQHPPNGKSEMPTDYENVDEILRPEGFLKRTEERGLVCGWAPQGEVLAHKAIGGFVSHCGWNSILESLWYGIPIATWPMYAEQQMNAFELVRELGLAVELKLDYKMDGNEVVMAAEIERAIKCLLDDKNPVRKRVKEMGEKGRKAVMDGGSSFISLGKLIEDMLGNNTKATDCM